MEVPAPAPSEISVPQVPIPSRSDYSPQRPQQRPQPQQLYQDHHQFHGSVPAPTGFDRELKSGRHATPTLPSNSTLNMPNPAFQQQQVQAQIRSQIGSQAAPPGYKVKVFYYENTKYIGPTTLNRPHYKSKQTWEWDVYPHGVSKQNGKIRLQIKQKGGNPTYPTFPNTLEGVLAAAMFRDKQALKLWKEGKLVRMPKINFDHPKEMLQKPKKKQPTTSFLNPNTATATSTTAVSTKSTSPLTATHVIPPNPASFLHLNGIPAVPPPDTTPASSSTDLPFDFGAPPLDLSSMPTIDFSG
uniref:Uncharacterized protein n=1 Tax=Lotharella oceanica TaxID=641309 RepID=A0A7S2TQ43_9EUKA